MDENDKKNSFGNKVYSFDDLIEYENNIKALATKKPKSEELIFNDSIVHAALIMATILENSNSVVNMYCGKFSIFKNSFNDKLSKMFQDPEYNEVRNTDKFRDFDPYKKTVNALESFLKRGGKMHVIMQDDPFSLTQERIWHDFLGDYYHENRISFREYDKELKLYHFTVGDNEMYRQESDSELRTAFACFNNKKIATLLNSSFEILKKNAPLVNLN